MAAEFAEIVHWLKKINGKYSKQSGIRAYPAGGDHLFVPKQTFDDQGGTIAVNSFINKIKVPSDSPAEAKINFDRPVTGSEYSVVWPGTGKTFGRIADFVYIKAPTGQETKVEIEVLKMVK